MDVLWCIVVGFFWVTTKKFERKESLLDVVMCTTLVLLANGCVTTTWGKW
jgi:hypothetical protein